MQFAAALMISVLLVLTCSGCSRGETGDSKSTTVEYAVGNSRVIIPLPDDGRITEVSFAEGVVQFQYAGMDILMSVLPEDAPLLDVARTSQKYGQLNIGSRSYMIHEGDSDMVVVGHDDRLHLHATGAVDRQRVIALLSSVTLE